MIAKLATAALIAGILIQATPAHAGKSLYVGPNGGRTQFDYQFDPNTGNGYGSVTGPNGRRGTWSTSTDPYTGAQHINLQGPNGGTVDVERYYNPNTNQTQTVIYDRRGRRHQFYTTP